MLFLLSLSVFRYDFSFASYEFKNHFFFSRYYWPNMKSDSFKNDLIEKLIQFWTKLRSRDFPKIAIKLIISRLVQVRSALGGNCHRAMPRMFDVGYGKNLLINKLLNNYKKKERPKFILECINLNWKNFYLSFN